MLESQMRLFAFILFVAALLPAQTPTTATYTPLTAKDRRDHFLHQTFLSPGVYFASLGSAGFAHLYKDPPEWGQGLSGYSRRSANSFASLIIQYSVSEGAAAALHYDPRYQRCDCAGGMHRFGHAFAWSFLTKNDAGQTRLNIPGLAGAYAGGMIPLLWYPDRYSPLRDGFREGSQQFGYTVGLNIIREFSPELRRIVHRKTTP